MSRVLAAQNCGFKNTLGVTSEYSHIADSQYYYVRLSSLQEPKAP